MQPPYRPQTFETELSDPQQYERQHLAQQQGYPGYGAYQQQEVPQPQPQQPYVTYGPNPPQPHMYGPPPQFSEGYVFVKLGPSALSRLGGVASYACGWISGFILLLYVKENRFVRFHAMQALLFFGGYTALFIAFIRMMQMPLHFLHGFAIFAFVLMNIIVAIGWCVGVIGAICGKYVKLPFVGDWAERFANGKQPSHVK